MCSRYFPDFLYVPTYLFFPYFISRGSKILGGRCFLPQVCRNYPIPITYRVTPGQPDFFFLWCGRSRSKARSLHENKQLSRKLQYGHRWSHANWQIMTTKHKTPQPKGKTQIPQPDLRLTITRTVNRKLPQGPNPIGTLVPHNRWFGKQKNLNLSVPLRTTYLISFPLVIKPCRK